MYLFLTYFTLSNDFKPYHDHNNIQVGELMCTPRVSSSRSFNTLAVLIIYIVKSSNVLSMIEERKHDR